jgi:hypothetical protein
LARPKQITGSQTLTQINPNFSGRELCFRDATHIRNADLKEGNVYVSNLALPEDGIADRGSVQFRHRANLSIASCNKASTCGIRYRFIERVHIDAGRELDRGSVGGGEERMGQGHHQVGQLPEAVEQTKTRGPEELAIPL